MTEFEYAVKSRLMEREKSQTWLVGQVREKTGSKISNAYLNRIIKGTNRSVTNVSAICEILDLDRARFV